MKRIALVFGILLYMGCAQAPDDGAPDVVATSPDDATDKAPALGSHEQASTNEPFSCATGPNGTGSDCHWPWRGNETMFTRFWKQYGGTTAYPYGDPGEGVSYFYTAATRRFTITSLEWRIEFAGGSTCLAGNCTFFICQDQGIQYPRCAQSNDPIGTTYTFNGEVFEPYENNRFFIAVWITGGPAVSATTTYEMIIAHHNSI